MLVSSENYLIQAELNWVHLVGLFPPQRFSSVLHAV